MSSNSEVSITVQTTHRAAFTIFARPELTVGQFKLRLESHVGSPPSLQRLIAKGRVLSDDRATLASYGIVDGSTIHFVQGKTPASVAPAAPPPAGDPMAGMLNSPMMRSLLDSPEAMRALLQQSPQMQAMMEQNPEMSRLLNDPAILRQSIEAMRNPQAMQHMQRSNELALAQLENHPGGFQHIRRMYEQVQEPMMAAADRAGAPAAVAPPTAPTTGPLQNPWAPAAPAVPAARFAEMPGMDMRGMMGGMPGMGAGDARAALLRDPAMQQMMSSVFSNPAALDAMIASNPMLQQMVRAARHD